MDKLVVTINLKKTISGLDNIPVKDLLKFSQPTEEDVSKAPDLTLGKLLIWILLDGIPAEKIKDAKNVIEWSDNIQKCIDSDGKIEVTEGDISQIEELLGKIKNPAMTTGRYLGSVIRALEEAKGKIIIKKQLEKEKPKDNKKQ